MRSAIRKHLGDFTAIVALCALAFGVTGYILFHQLTRPYFPLIEPTPYTIKAVFSTAQAVTPGQGQDVRVAGVKVGTIKQVGLQEGRAVVTMQLDHKYSNLVHTNATALLRPRTGLQDMFIELDPGANSAPRLQSDGTIPVQNTTPNVNPDEIWSVLDSDTRSYLQLLVNGAGGGLAQNGDNLRAALSRLEPLHEDLDRINAAVAQRRDNLARLIHNYGDLMNTLGDRDRDLTNLVTQSNQVLGAFAQQNQNVSAAIEKLPPTLQDTQNTLQKVNTLGQQLGPTLDSLRPGFRALPNTNAQLIPLGQQGTPILQNEIRPFVRQARPFVTSLRPTATNLAQVAPDLTASLNELNRFYNMLSYNKPGASGSDQGYNFWLAWLAQNGNSIFSTSDASGPFRRVVFAMNCGYIQDLLKQNPNNEFVLGVSGLLDMPNSPCPRQPH